MLDVLVDIIQRSPLILIKLALLILLLLYIAFGVIVYRQTQMMTKVVEADASPTVELVAFVHLLGTIFLFLWALLTL